jgi:hypothetical protein
MKYEAVFKIFNIVMCTVELQKGRRKTIRLKIKASIFATVLKEIKNVKKGISTNFL